MNNNTNKFALTNISVPTAGLLAKGVQPKNKENKQAQADLTELAEIASRSFYKNEVTNDTRDLLPDIEYCVTTSTNNILAPTDNMTKALGLDFKTAKLPSSVKSGLLTLTSDTLINVYGFNGSKLEEIISTSKYYDGSYVEIFIPEAAIDEIINKDAGTIKLEDYHSRFNNATKHNILDSSNEYGVEFDLKTESGVPVVHNSKVGISYKQMESMLNVSLTDDIGIINDKTRESTLLAKSMDNAYYSDLKTEAGENLNSVEEEQYDKIMNMLKSPDSFDEEAVVTLSEYDTTRRESIGRPLWMKVNPASIKPIWSGDPSNHKGYILLLDEKGNPITSTPSVKKEKEMNNFFKVNKQNTNHKYEAFIKKARKSLYGITGKDPELKNMPDLYESMLNNLITKKISRGLLGESVTWTEDNEFTKIMFARALESKKTRMLFIPASMVTYYAYDYRDNGMGRGKVERISVLYSMRAILLFVRLMSTVKNSIPRTIVKADLPDDITDVNAAVADIMYYTSVANESEIPLQAPNTNKIYDWMQRVGMSYQIKHPAYPSIDFEIEDQQRSIPTPDSTLEDMLESASYKQFGMSKEMVDEGFKSSTATSASIQNKFFGNRIVNAQNETIPIFSNNFHKIIKNDNTLYSQFKDIVKQNINAIKKKVAKEIKDTALKDDVLVKAMTDWLISDLTMTLPPVLVEDGDTLHSSIKDHADNVESYLETIFADEAWDKEEFGELADEIDSIKAKLKAVIVHDFAIDNHIMKPINDMFTKNADGEVLSDGFKDFSLIHSIISEVYMKHLRASKKTTDAFDKKKDKLDNDEPDIEDTGTSESNTGGDEPTADEGDEGVKDPVDNIEEA